MRVAAGRSPLGTAGAAASDGAGGIAPTTGGRVGALVDAQFPRVGATLAQGSSHGTGQWTGAERTSNPAPDRRLEKEHLGLMMS
jgi:hypothetical protein